MKCAFAASLLSTQHSGVRAKTGWLGMRIMCPNEVTGLQVDCCIQGRIQGGGGGHPPKIGKNMIFWG